MPQNIMSRTAGGDYPRLPVPPALREIHGVVFWLLSNLSDSEEIEIKLMESERNRSVHWEIISLQRPHVPENVFHSHQPHVLVIHNYHG
jgi:hypothetical protein